MTVSSWQAGAATRSAHVDVPRHVPRSSSTACCDAKAPAPAFSRNHTQAQLTIRIAAILAGGADNPPSRSRAAPCHIRANMRPVRRALPGILRALVVVAGTLLYLADVFHLPDGQFRTT